MQQTDLGPTMNIKFVSLKGVGGTALRTGLGVRIAGGYTSH